MRVSFEHESPTFGLLQVRADVVGGGVEWLDYCGIKVPRYEEAEADLISAHDAHDRDVLCDILDDDEIASLQAAAVDMVECRNATRAEAVYAGEID